MKLKKLDARGFSHDVLIVLFIVIFAIAGVAYLVYSRASTWGSVYSTVVDSNASKCLDVKAKSTSDGGVVEQWTCNGGTNQNWRFVATATTGVFDVVNQNSGKCLEVKSFGTADGSTVDQWGCNGGGNQHWIVHAVGGSYELVNKYANKCLDVKALSTADGATVEIWNCNGGSNQLWHGTSVSSAYTYATQPQAPQSPPPGTYNGPSGPVGSLVGCTSYSYSSSSCAGSWVVFQGGPQVYQDVSNARGPVIAHMYYIDDTTPPCDSNMTVSQSESCMNNLIWKQYNADPGSTIYYGSPSGYGTGWRAKNPNTGAVLANVYGLDEWYPVYTGSSTVPCGAQGYFLQRYFNGTSTGTTQYSGFNSLWSQASACNSGSTKPIAWW